MLAIIQGLRALGSSMAWIVSPLMSTAYLSMFFLSALTLAFLFLLQVHDGWVTVLQFSEFNWVE